MHRRQVMEKMRAGSLAELVKICERVKEPSWSAQPNEQKGLSELNPYMLFISSRIFLYQSIDCILASRALASTS